MFEIVLPCQNYKTKKPKIREACSKCFIGYSSNVSQRPMRAVLFKMGAASTNETPFIVCKQMI